MALINEEDRVHFFVLVLSCFRTLILFLLWQMFQVKNQFPAWVSLLHWNVIECWF